MTELFVATNAPTRACFQIKQRRYEVEHIPPLDVFFIHASSWRLPTLI
jgi:hypothetical protein